MSEGTSSATAPRAPWGLLEGLLLAAAGLFALAFQLYLPTTHVAEGDYQAVAGVLAAEARPGDVVLLAPWWTERARLYVPQGLPVVGYQGSDSDALERHPRVWVLAEPRLPRAGLSSFHATFDPGRTPAGDARTFGNLSLQLFTNGRYRPVSFDAVEGLAAAQVYLETPDGQRQPCTWTGAGHRCPNGKTVAREWHEVHYAPKDCLKLEAPGGAARVVVELLAPAADRTSLEAGYIWEYGAYKENVTPSTLWLEVDGQAQALELPTGDETLHHLEGPALREGARVRVALASQVPTARVVCVTLAGTKGAP